MEFLQSLLSNAHALIVIIAGIFSLIAWKQTDYSAPRYIHVIAFISGCVGVLLALLSHVAEHSHSKEAIWLVFGFPAATYFIFGFFGGGHVMVDKGHGKE